MRILIRFIRFVTTVAGVGLLVWLMRDRMVNLPVRTDESFPVFRSSPPVHEPPHEDVTAITGIGPVFAERLAEVGIDSVVDLSTAPAITVAAAAGVSEQIATDWISQATAANGTGQ